jgi:tetratricopeptide (TPR) repeat protein
MALQFYEKALAIHSKVGDKQGEANALASIGNVYYNTGQLQKTLAYYEQGLALYKHVGD